MRRAIQVPCICLIVCAFAGRLSGMTLEADLDDVVANPKIAGRLLGETGAWRTKTQQVFDPVERTLIRRLYTVWDPEPSRNLDFVWIPDALTDDREGAVNGQGRLIWRIKGKPAYEPASIFAEFRGSMKDGRPDGRGTYSDRSGLAYEGEWKNGVMDGHGRLKLPNADEYIGQFRAGKANGAGRYVDITGEIFEGQFVDGLREGRGTTRLPNGLSYRSAWVAGEGTEGSRAVRLSQVGAQRMPGGSDDVRVAIEVDSGRDADVKYTASSIGPVLWIRPDGKLFDVWKGGAELQFEGDPGPLKIYKRDGVAMTLKIGVQNRSTQPFQVAGLYLDVQSSAADLQPAIQVKVGRLNACGFREFWPALKFENFGWSPAEHAALRFAFASSPSRTQPGTLNLSRSLGRIDKAVTVDLEPELHAAGVDTALLKSRANAALPCSSGDRNTCFEELKSSGLFGSLSQSINLAAVEGLSPTQEQVVVGAIGTLEYGWTDDKGNSKRQVSKFNAILGLGQLLRGPTSACAEEGGPEVIARRALSLGVDQSAYRLPVSFAQRPLPAGRTSWLTLPVQASKSSQHEFRVVVQMADGSEIASRPIRLQYYVPRWFPGEER